MAAHLTAVRDNDDTSGASGTPWEAPIPLGDSRSLPGFPVEVLPDWLGRMVTAVAAFTQTPPDLAGCVALAAISTAIGGRSVVHIRPGYREPSNLFVVAAMPPGSRKSDVFRLITAPLREVQTELQEQAAPRIKEAELAKRIAEREARDAEEKATSDDPDTVTDATEAVLRAERIEVPAKPKLIVDDITPEKAKSRLIEQGGRLAVLAPEGGIISIIAGRYSGAPDFDLFLRGHAGEPIDVERQHRDDEGTEHAYLTLGLVVQPVVLKNLAAIPDAREKGLLGRILYSLPTSLVGWRETRNAPPVPDETGAEFNARLRQLVRHHIGLPKPAVFTFDHAADEAMHDLQDDVEPNLRPGAAYSHMTDWAGKYPGATARLAGTLHAAAHLDQAADHPITAATFAAARRLGEYFLAHALATYDHMGTDKNLDDARLVLDWIEREHPICFTRRDVLNAHRRRFKTVEAITPALTVLEDHGHIIRSDPPARTGPGRKPGATYWPHPIYRAPEDRP